jgi:DNA-binding NarL/FixJ family response regulator
VVLRRLAALDVAVARALLGPLRGALAERVDELERSRARVIDSGEAERRRLERDLNRVRAGGTALDPEVVDQLLVRPRVSDDPLDQLTPRERQVMAMMADGLSNRAMASALAVTERAVERHVTGIFGKLGLGADGACHRRVVAVLRYVRRDAAPVLA